MRSLQEFAGDSLNMHELRAFLRELAPGLDIGRLHDHEVLRLLAARMTGAEMTLTPLPLAPAPVSATFTEETEEAPAADTTPDEVERELTWIEIELLDDDDTPIPNEAYRIRLPDGRTLTGNLDDEGYARLTEIPAGTCTVRFPNLPA